MQNVPFVSGSRQIVLNLNIVITLHSDAAAQILLLRLQRSELEKHRKGWMSPRCSKKTLCQLNETQHAPVAQP